MLGEWSQGARKAVVTLECLSCGGERLLPKMKLGCFEVEQLLPHEYPQRLNRQRLERPLNRGHAGLVETMLCLSVFPQSQRIPPLAVV